jgi:hypothetical protein
VVLGEIHAAGDTVEFTGESDRAVVILAASILDDVLVYAIGKRLAISVDETQADYIFRAEGPLGSFSARIEIAYVFGFIDDLTRDQLTTVRESAHSKRPIGFDVPELANVAKRLFHPTGVAPLTEDTRAGIKGAFFVEFCCLYHIMIEGSREKGIPIVLDAIRKHAASAPSPDKPIEP